MVNLNIFAALVETNTSITNMFLSSIHNPYELITIVIELVLGLALGYVSVKVLKYILAFILIVIVGIVLNVWSFGGSLSNTISVLQSEAVNVEPVIRNLITALGLLTIGPILLGFIIGLIIGIARK
ncbi:MAG: hypothetical protein ACP5M8_08045 [Caldisphaera sp.]|jgi:hypothetical protein|nr:hypothetical protein [Caldisphaera sp.]